ncbi:MAG TPA: hypothetical protein VD994_03715 [Prosthecobacter sp.]|nr:hypothetical protein [Prosthecobacter sp.]
MPHPVLITAPRFTPGMSVVLRAAPEGPVMIVTSRSEEKAGTHCTVKWLDLGAHPRVAEVSELDLIRF